MSQFRQNLAESLSTLRNSGPNTWYDVVGKQDRCRSHDIGAHVAILGWMRVRFAEVFRVGCVRFEALWQESDLLNFSRSLFLYLLPVPTLNAEGHESQKAAAS